MTMKSKIFPLFLLMFFNHNIVFADIPFSLQVPIGGSIVTGIENTKFYRDRFNNGKDSQENYPVVGSFDMGMNLRVGYLFLGIESSFYSGDTVGKDYKYTLPYPNTTTQVSFQMKSLKSNKLLMGLAFDYDEDTFYSFYAIYGESKQKGKLQEFINNTLTQSNITSFDGNIIGLGAGLSHKIVGVSANLEYHAFNTMKESLYIRSDRLFVKISFKIMLDGVMREVIRNY